MNYGTFLAILIGGPALTLILYVFRKRFVIPMKYVLAPMLAMIFFFAFCYVDLILQWRLFDRVTAFWPL